ncbi:MAG: carboxypeptidase-like regulatory domain-containing protein [Bacteroidales bacterium]|nr:carboxypeptidase-like regulatory domain-containing protein [Bacteroidales bacterium]MBN2762768.1 carboxypeptidase-like regulatory domain-containing protein [Bacteroidales bacterium]
MKKIVFLTLTGLFISSSIFCVEKNKTSTSESKKTTSVMGSVVDKISGESLAGVAIKFTGTDKVVYTDLEGHFEVQDLVPGTYEIEAVLISYKQSNKKVKLDLRTSGNNISIELENLK